MREGRTAGGSNKHRSSEQRQRCRAMTDLRCRFAIHFIFNFSEIKRERLRERQREKERNTLREGRREHQAPEQRQSDLRSPISDLRSTICDEGRPGERQRRQRASCSDDDGDVTVHGLLGLVLVCVLGIFFFFFFINTSVLCPLC